MLNCYNVQDYLRGGSLLLLGLGVSVQNSRYYTVALILAIIAMVKDRQCFSNKKNNKFYITTVLFLTYILVGCVIVFLQNNYEEVGNIFKLYKCFIPFFYMFIFIDKPKNYFFWSAIGFLLGIFYNDVSLFKQFINGETDFGARYPGRYGHPNYLGAYIELSVPLIIYYCVYFKNKLLYFLLGIIAGIGAVASLYLSGSRGAVIAVGLEIFVCGIIYFYKENKKDLLYKIIGFLGIMFIVLVFYNGNIFSRSYDGERILLWISAWEMFSDYPILGVGFNNWNDIYRHKYISELAREPYLCHPHNIFLYILSSMGIVFFFLSILLLFYQVKISCKYSVLDKIVSNKKICIIDMMLIVITGMIVHNMVDAIFLSRYYMTIYLFFWGLCCYRMGEIDNDLIKNTR